ncbi:MAG: LPD29 domain-containing protein [Caldisericia bacterium]
MENKIVTAELTQSEKIHLSMKEIAKLVRNQLKKEFLWCVFSVRKSTHSLRISLLRASFEAFVPEITNMFSNGLTTKEEQVKILEYMKEKGHSQVNHYYIKTSIFYTDECKKVLQRVKELTDEYNYDNSDVQSDYFDVNFYLHLHIGEWDKPFRRV